MKRSEMVKLMWDFIGTVEYDYDRYMDEENVEELLVVMEKAGMLPPYDPTHLDHGSVMDCQWSPEIEMTEEEFKKITSS